MNSWKTTNRRDGDLSNAHWECEVDGKPTGVYSNEFYEIHQPALEHEGPITIDAPVKNISNDVDMPIMSHIEYTLHWTWRYGDEKEVFTGKKQMKAWWKGLCDMYDPDVLGMKVVNVTKQKVTPCIWDSKDLLEIMDKC